MDPEGVMKNFVHLANQYTNNKSDSNWQQLQKQLDILIGLTGIGCKTKVFDPRHLVVADCISCMSDMLNDPEVPPVVSQKIIAFLENLVSSPHLLMILQSRFNIAYTLASFLSSTLSSKSDPLFLQCLQVLQTVTYHEKFSDDFHDDLLQFLIRQIYSAQGELLLPSLSLLANLCRRSVAVCQHIKNMESLKVFYKSLVSLISSHSDQAITIASLSVITALALNDEIGDRLYKASNIHQTFELLFNILISGDCDNCCNAVDLFLDLIPNNKIQQYLARYPHFEVCLSRLLQLLTSTSSPKSTGKLIQLLHGFCCVQSLKEIVIPTILKSETESTDIQPITVAIHWFSSGNEASISLVALDFLTVIFKACVPPAAPADLGVQVDQLLQVIVKELEHTFDPDDLSAKWHCVRLAKIFDFLTVLISEPLYLEKVAEELSLNTCQAIIEMQFDQNKVPVESCPIADWSENGVDVLLGAVNFLITIAVIDNNVQEYLVTVLQDPRLASFIAAALMSNSSLRAEKALSLITAALQTRQFSAKRLAESIARRIQQVDTKSALGQRTNPYLRPPGPWGDNGRKTFCPMSPQQRKKKLESNVESLIERMEKGLDIKDMKASEIMDMYEHKIESFRTKERHLQDLLEAKASALQHADRMLAQYRCGWAQSDAEGLKLRTLLQESEKRSEEAKEQTTSALAKNQQLRHNLEEAEAEIQTLEQHAEERSEAYAELAERLEASENACDSLRQENTAAVELNTMLQRHNETYKQKQESLMLQLTELEGEKKNLSKQLKERDSKIKDLTKKNQNLEESVKMKSNALADSEESVSRLRDHEAALERDKQALQQEVSSLEGNVRQLEAKLKEKHDQFKLCKEELEKHRQITAMIQNISSGRLDILSMDK